MQPPLHVVIQREGGAGLNGFMWAAMSVFSKLLQLLVVTEWFAFPAGLMCGQAAAVRPGRAGMGLERPPRSRTGYRCGAIGGG